MIDKKRKVTSALYEILRAKKQEAEQAFKKFNQARTEENEGPRDNLDNNGHNQELILKSSLAKAEKTLDNCTPIDGPRDTKRVNLGHIVTIKRDGIPQSIRIDGISIRGANPPICSAGSVLGKQLLGKEVGESFFLDNGTSQIVEIMEIRLP